MSDDESAPHHPNPTPPKTGVTTLFEATFSLCHVPRWSIVPVSRVQSVAEHSFRVAMIIRELGHQLDWPSADTNSLMAIALLHDVTEAVTGDIPEPFKYELRQDLLARNGNLDHLVYTICPWLGDRVQLGSIRGPEFDRSYSIYLKLADILEARCYLSSWGKGQMVPGILRRLDTHLNVLVGKLTQHERFFFTRVMGEMSAFE